MKLPTVRPSVRFSVICCWVADAAKLSVATCALKLAPGAHLWVPLCAEARGETNRTPAASISRRRKTRVGKREIPVRVAESKQGGVSYRRSASRRLFQDSRGLQGRAAPAPGNSLPPKVSLQVPLHPPYHQYDEANYNHKSGAMSTRPPPPKIRGRPFPYSRNPGKTGRCDGDMPEKPRDTNKAFN